MARFADSPRRRRRRCQQQQRHTQSSRVADSREAACSVGPILSKRMFEFAASRSRRTDSPMPRSHAPDDVTYARTQLLTLASINEPTDQRTQRDSRYCHHRCRRQLSRRSRDEVGLLRRRGQENAERRRDAWGRACYRVASYRVTSKVLQLQ